MLSQIIEIRDYVIDARHRLIRIFDPASNDEDIAVYFHDGAVFAILIETA
jgi:hypothetical protein